MSVGDWIAIAAIVLTILGAIIGCVWLAGRWFERANTAVEKIPEFETRLNAFETKLDEVVATVAKIFAIIAKNSDSQLLKSSSPIQLTESGEKLFDRVGGSQIVKNHFDKIPIKEDMNPYKIQKACTDFAFLKLMDTLSAEEEDAVQLVAYKDGIAVETILNVLGIRFRDAWLERMGLDVEVVGKHELEAQT